MKKIFAILMVLMLATVAWATNPTVTVTKVDIGLEYVEVYSFSFSTTLAANDTAIILKPNGNPFLLDHLGITDAPYGSTVDSMLSVYYNTTETTVDSIRHTIVLQSAFAVAPGAQSTSTDWKTLVTVTKDSVAAASRQFNMTPKQSGLAVKGRLLWIESDTDKDAAQTVSGWIVVPKSS